MWETVLGLIASSATFSRLCCLAHPVPQCMIAYCALLQIPIQTINLSMTTSFQLIQEDSNSRNGRKNSESRRQAIMNSLRDLAAEQIRTDNAFLGKRRFSVDQQSHALSYDLSP